jgi:hypothetical protein
MKKLLLGTAALAAFAVAEAPLDPAEAVPAYGYAQLGFTDFSLSGLSGPGVAVSNTGVTTQAGSNYPGFTPFNNSINGNLVTGSDVPEAYSGNGSVPQNTFTQQLTAGAAARGDAQISGPLSGPAVSNDVSEGRLTSTGGTASSNSGTSTGLKLTLTVSTTDTLTLHFLAEALMNTNSGEAGDHAFSVISASYNIQAGASGHIVSSSNSLGSGGNGTIVGGTDFTYAPTALNHTINSLGATDASTYTISGFGTNLSVVLDPGIYNITLSSGTQESLTTAPAVPEPTSLAVFGAGLLGLAGAVRRRWKAGTGRGRLKN